MTDNIGKGFPALTIPTTTLFFDEPHLVNYLDKLSLYLKSFLIIPKRAFT